ncbi:DUF4268 domain-containing protein [Methanobrevibacter ruminantium]|uniref:DUF4268 domain-containing protein n=1 Tax=Methanobrevibacter ruminantium TaxID=83816 RepID=UPI002D80E7BF|nr:DUF4268 domain-containing protein [Methanobrevibacter ruminantium]
MSSIFNRLDEIEETVMDELKDFQRATVERIDYLYRHGQNRILVSDEVGLGKTLVARGTIAKFAKLRRDEGDNLVKVVYICSNATIAEQNLDKLRIVNELRAENTHTSRLSMQHLNIFNQENDQNVLNRYIQLIPLTPETSFKVSNSQGTRDERALMFAILRRLPTFRNWKKQLEEIFRFGVHYWEGTRNYYDDQVKLCDENSNGEYVKYMVEEVHKNLIEIKFGDKDLLSSLKDLCRKIKREGFVKRDAKPFIVRLRIMFADISLNKLEPDLIIMDEFQRFKYLLSSDKNSEMDRLVNKFFNSEDMRILMLSATPYKMYSTLDEIDEEQIDAHYSEFFNVIDFLNVCKKERIKFREVWSNYSLELKEFSKDKTSFISAKTKAENAMFKSICRTERITETEVVDIVDDFDANHSLKVSKEDIQSFMDAQKLLDEIGLNNNVPIDYVKSSPYLMSFMKNYQLKRRIERYFRNNKKDIPKMKKSTFWINENYINHYKEISPNNARLNDLMSHVLKDNAEKLLWIPPAQPYYPSEGVFEGIEDFSKTLIFSSWEMVPRMISSILSYEVERKTIGKLENENHDIKYFAKNRYPSPRLNFNLNDDKPAQMSLFSLIYPSIFLIDVYNPIDCLNRSLSLKEIEKEVKSKIQNKLNQIPSNENSREDARWYYLAPLLLDKLYSKDFVKMWFEGIDHFITEGVFYQKGFLKHFELLKNQFDEYSLNPKELGRKPDDLIDILCDMTIASPAICIYRAYSKEAVGKKVSIDDFVEIGLIDNSLIAKGVTIDDFMDVDLIEKKLAKRFLSKNYLVKKGLIDKNLAENGISRKDLYEKQSIVHYSHIATQVARRFLNRMNTPESIAVIDLIFKQGSEDAYWQNLLKYSKQGNLQAVFDEYVHLLSNGLDENNKDRILIINQKLLNSMEIRAASYDFDTYKSFSSRMKGRNKSSPSLRTHFSVSFTKGKSDQRDTNRKKTVRDAFNSPFRPFVLASTSIGQEGLDFHNYCRRIVHWNLPSNPIDLEQREGRINRFECLAIRQNVAKRYGNRKFETDDVWKELFEEASKREKVGECSDLIPYWGLKDSEDMVKIERIVPMYPFSRDEIRYDRLIKILSLYRLTLGQSRQEQILENIFNDLDNDENNQTIEDIQGLFINLSPYYKKDIEDFEIDCEEIKEDKGEGEEETIENTGDLTEPVDEDSPEDLSKDNYPNDFEGLELITDDFDESKEVSDEIDDDLNELENEIDENYSQELGADEDMDIKIRYCFNCGSELVIKGAKFCHNCGQDLRVENLDLNVGLTVESSKSDNSINETGDENYDEIVDKSREYGFFIRPEIMDITTNDLDEISKISEDSNELNVDLSSYWEKVKTLIDENNLFNTSVYNWEAKTCWIPIEGVILDLARIEMLVHEGFIHVMIYSPAHNGDKALFHYLKVFRKQIEEELGFALNWLEKVDGNRFSINVYVPININNEDLWEDAINWHIFMAKRFDDVFSDRIRDYYDNNPFKFDDSLRTNYWEKLTNELNKTNLVSMEVPHPDPYYRILLDNIPISDSRIELHAYYNKRIIKVSLIIERHEKGLYNYLKRERKIIEGELGFKLNWLSQWNFRITVENNISIKDSNNWQDAINWHLSTAKKFKKVFDPKIKEFFNQ